MFDGSALVGLAHATNNARQEWNEASLTHQGVARLSGKVLGAR